MIKVLQLLFQCDKSVFLLSAQLFCESFLNVVKPHVRWRRASQPLELVAWLIGKLLHAGFWRELSSSIAFLRPSLDGGEPAVHQVARVPNPLPKKRSQAGNQENLPGAARLKTHQLSWTSNGCCKGKQMSFFWALTWQTDWYQIKPLFAAPIASKPSTKQYWKAIGGLTLSNQSADKNKFSFFCTLCNSATCRCHRILNLLIWQSSYHLMVILAPSSWSRKA